MDLQGKQPEDFNWSAYFASRTSSVSDEVLAAEAAHKVLKGRIDELCRDYRSLMEKRGDTEGLKRFNSVQELWQKFADAEVALVGGAWDGGSGARAAYAKHRFKVYLRRVKELVELMGDCSSLNE